MKEDLDTIGDRGQAAGTRSRLLGPLGVLAVATVAYVWALDASGYGNEYYAAAAYSGSMDWSAWLFGSFDSASFISVDKPPLSLWITGLSIRAFGLSSWSVLLPHAVAGVATVAILYGTVRRWHGEIAGFLAALTMTVTPVALVMFRYNNPDAILTLLMVSAVAVAYAATRRGSGWLLAAAGMITGLAFLTKTTQSLLIIPAIAITYLVAAPVSLRRRLAHGLGAGAAALVSAGWWIALTEVSSTAPYYGQTSTGSFIDYIFGINGLGRVGGDTRPGDPFGGSDGWGRLFNTEVGGQVSWLIPLAVAGLLVALWRRRWNGREDLVGSGWLLWGTVFATHFIVFSMMSGVFHPYYSMSMAPATAALVGAGSVEIWHAYRDRASSWWLLPIAIVTTGAWSWALLARTPDFLPWLGPVVGLASMAIGLTFIVSFVGPGLSSRSATAIVAASIMVLLAGPVSYAVASIGVDYSGGDPKAGPGETGIPEAPGGPHVAAAQTRAADGPPGPPPRRQREASRLPGPPGDDGLRQTPRGDDLGRDGRPGSWLSDELVQYLVAEQADETWIAATMGSGTASRLILETGDAVMAMGGFAGGDPTPTAQELTGYIKSGELRFIVVGQRQELRRWAETIQDLCTPVQPNVSGSSPGSVLYDCYTGADI